MPIFYVRGVASQRDESSLAARAARSTPFFSPIPTITRASASVLARSALSWRDAAMRYPDAMTTTTTLAERLAGVRARIDAACVAAGRNPSDVTLVGVSKTHPVEAVQDAVQAGLLDLGENWEQELVPKAEGAAALGLAPRWHFIGHLQRNRVR